MIRTICSSGDGPCDKLFVTLEDAVLLSESPKQFYTLPALCPFCGVHTSHLESFLGPFEYVTAPCDDTLHLGDMTNDTCRH